MGRNFSDRHLLFFFNFLVKTLYVTLKALHSLNILNCAVGVRKQSILE